MAYTQGSENNPMCIADGDDDKVPWPQIQPSTQNPEQNDGGSRWNSTRLLVQKKDPVYYSLDDDGTTTLLPTEGIPNIAQNRKKSKANRRSANSTTPSNASLTAPNGSFAEKINTRMPSAKPTAEKPIVISDDEPATPSRNAARKDDAESLSSKRRTVTPSSSGGHVLTSEKRLPERIKPLETSPSSLASRKVYASVIAKQDFTQVTPSRATRKSSTPLTGEISLRPAAQVTEPSMAGAAPELPARNVTPMEPQEMNSAPELNPSDVQQKGSVMRSPKRDVGQPDETMNMSANHPFGVRAESQRGREQGTIRHVEMNATSKPGRVNISKALEKDGLSALLANRRKSSGIDTPKPKPKPRMVKRAVSPPRPKTISTEPPQHSIESYVRGLSPPESIMRGSFPPETSEERDLNEASTTGRVARQFSGNAYKTSSDLFPRDRNLCVTDAAVTGMGFQASTPSVAPSPVLPSIEANDTSIHQSKVANLRSHFTSLPTGMIKPTKAIDDTSTNVAPESTANIDNQALPVFMQGNAADDLEPSQYNIEYHLKRRLEERYEDHAYLVKNTMWRQRTCYERDIRARSRGDQIRKVYMLPNKYVQSTSPFANMRAIQVPHEKGHSKDMMEISQDVFTNASPKDTVVRSAWSVPTTAYRTGGFHIPSSKEYISLRTNILADNESRLLTMPYLGDNDDERAQTKLVEELPLIYEIRHDVNALSDLRNEQCRFYTDSIDAFLEDIGVSWDMILYWLLMPDASLKRINQTFVQRGSEGLPDRSAYDTETFQRDEEQRKAVLLKRRPGKWRELLRQLKEPSLSQLKTAALTCAVIFTNCNFSPWYLARRSATIRRYVQQKTTASEPTSIFAFRKVACRVCHEHNCLFHGQIREQPESKASSRRRTSKSFDEIETEHVRASFRQTRHSQDDDKEDNDHDDDEDDDDASSASLDVIPAHVDDSDSDVERIINYKVAANPDVLADDTTPKSISTSPIPPPGPFKASWWERNTSTYNWERRKPFIPCNHNGSCIEADCRCFREGVTCEKSCRCPPLCNRRFPGCSCDSVPGQRICRTPQKCLCVKFQRECDADLCFTCGATEILDPVNRYNEELLQDRCTNVGIQRAVPKKTLLGQSEVHGFGLYAGQDIEKDDIIGEYTGEVISVEESARRELIYTYQKNMYLFKLNKEQEVDATFMGNKLRFINNANHNLTNCFPKVLLCNTVFRVAIYASTDIKAGTELFFHYNYPQELTRHFKQPTTNGKVVAVKQTVKQPLKTQKKRATSHSSGYKSTELSSGAGLARGSGISPWVHKALAKARAAKAAKREAMLANGQAEQNGHRLGFKQARKSVASGPSQHITSKDSASRGRSVTRSKTREETDDDMEGMARIPNEVMSELEVQDTDEDNDFIPVDSQEAAVDPYEFLAGDEEDNPNFGPGQRTGGMAPRRPVGRPPGRMAKSAPSSTPIVTVTKVKKKMGGARPGAGRKRKRPLVLNSDEE